MDWNARYKDADTPWDKGQPSPIIDELILKLPQFFRPDTRVLIPGCGLGHDTQPFLAENMNVTAVDISALALEEAIRRYGANQSLEWQLADIFNMPKGQRSSYDLIWEHTCYCAIEPSQREAYADAMFDLLKPNEHFIGTFFIDTGLPEGTGPPFQTSRDEAYHNFERKFSLVWEGKPTSSYPGRENREWVMIWRKPLSF